MILLPSHTAFRARRARYHALAIAALGLAAPASGEGGDDAATAVDLSARPFPIVEYGDTCDNTNAWGYGMCPYGSWAPDEWYAYMPTEAIELTFSLCDSEYDTLIWILDADLLLVACNDDACSDSQGNWYRSRIEDVALAEGDLYYILVDGYVDSCGLYELVISQCSGCPADVNGDCTIDVLDLLAVLGGWGELGGPRDVNVDGIVDVLDLLEILAAWGPCP